ncbi:MAG: RNA-guided endonuclease InsQ/TnpB family protein [Candidatus Kariarchaeaceae archaeon]
MLIRRTFQTKLVVTQLQQQLLLETLNEYRNAASYALNWGYINKITSRVKIHHNTYKAIRKKSNLPSQLVCASRNKATDVLLSLKRKKSRRKPGFHRLLPIRYDQRSATIKLDRKILSLSTTNKRIQIDLHIPLYARKYEKWQFKNFELRYWKKEFYVHFVVEKELQRKFGKCKGKIVGIDRGLKHIAVTSQNHFHSGSKIRSIKNGIFWLRRQFQKKGTRSAKRRLKQLSQKEQRFQKDQNHIISKKIISSIPQNSLLVLEDLKHIRKQVKSRKRYRRELHSWSFYQLELFLTYKGKEHFIEIVSVDPKYTSQDCNSCGYRDKRNRNGRSFLCVKCGFELNADLNAARNIRDRQMVGGISTNHGVLVSNPIVAS